MVDIDKLNELEKLYPTIYGNNIIYDGITDIEEYNISPIKILWILKEPDAKKQASWDLRKQHKNVKTYKYWKRTYKLIIKISYALINNIYDYKLIPSENKIDDILNKIAIINIKKTGGHPQAIQKEISNMYKKCRVIIQKQIEYINPTIIINSSGVYDVMRDFQKDIIMKKNKFEAAYFDNGIIINAYHTNQRTISHEMFFNNTMEYIKQNK